MTLKWTHERARQNHIAPPRGALHITRAFGGEMAEWFKAHAWKACVGLYPTEGSNPSLSASFLSRMLIIITIVLCTNDYDGDSRFDYEKKM
jgi:hypothetical protein